MFAATAIAGITYLFFYQRRQNHVYYTRFKKEIIEGIVKFCEPGFKYEMHGYILESEYKESLLDRMRDNQENLIYKGDDLVSGKIGKTDIRFSEIHIWGGDFEPYHALFFEAVFHKDFVGEILILPDAAENFLGRYGRALQKLRFHDISLQQMEDPRFEREFAVYSNFTNSLRYVLTPSLMEQIVAIKRMNKHKLGLSFIRGKMYILLETKDKSFEPKALKKGVDKETLRNYYEEIMFFINVVENLNLNTRIWTKE